MPHTKFRCPVQHGGQPDVPIETCLEHAKYLWRGCNWNQALLQAMVEVPDNRVSPTRLQQCPRQVALKRRVDYALDPKDEYLKIRGTLFHSGLEQLFGEGNELELERGLNLWEGETLSVYTIHGRLDRMDGGVVLDWKTKNYLRKTDGVSKAGTPIEKFSPPEEHIAQISIYAWLAQPRVEAPLEWGELMYATMTEVTRFIIRLWETSRVEAWLGERVPVLLGAYDDSTALALPLEGRDGKGKAQNWRCRSCPVLTQCREMEC